MRKEIKRLLWDRNHSHYWIKDGVLFESYKTIRGVRYRELMNVPELSDNDNLTIEEIIYIEANYLNK